MGIPLTLKKKRVQMPAPRKLLDDRSSSTNSVPVSERIHALIAGVEAAGFFNSLKRWLQDAILIEQGEQGFHRELIPRAEEMFEGHRDLLVALNTFLPDGYKCTVPDE